MYILQICNVQTRSTLHNLLNSCYV